MSLTPTAQGPLAYDDIGRLYAKHRRPDPRIAIRIDRALAGARRVLNVGAGTGSYERRQGDARNTCEGAGTLVVAADPSPVMIAQRPIGSAPVTRAVAEHLPFVSGTFDAAAAILTFHHWVDPYKGLAEMTRVADRIVILTFDIAIHRHFWLLEEYVPEVNELPSALVPSPHDVANFLGTDRVEVVPVPADCVDGFNWAFWNRPERYLDPEVRACMSGLAQLPVELVEQRMNRLRRDLDDGSWFRRHCDLMDMNSIDGGFRLVVKE